MHSSKGSCDQSITAEEKVFAGHGKHAKAFHCTSDGDIPPAAQVKELQRNIRELTLQHTREQEALRKELVLQGCFPMRRTSGLLPVTTVGSHTLPALPCKSCSTL